MMGISWEQAMNDITADAAKAAKWDALVAYVAGDFHKYKQGYSMEDHFYDLPLFVGGVAAVEMLAEAVRAEMEEDDDEQG